MIWEELRKITIIEDKKAIKAREFEVDRKSRFKKGSGFPVRIPVIEMVEIGAGGGSIARVNKIDQIPLVQIVLAHLQVRLVMLMVVKMQR